MRSGLAAACVLSLTAAFFGLAAAPLTSVSSDQKVIRAGKLVLAGRSMRCGRTPTLMSETFWDYGGSGRGMIILNPTKLETLPPTVRLFVYEHECGHQILGRSELKADCHAVQRGKRAGWLTAGGLEEICSFFRDHPSDSVHPPGPERCVYMSQCFEKAKPPRASR